MAKKAKAPTATPLVSVSKLVQAGSTPLKTYERSSVYNDVFNTMKGMKKGQEFIIDPPAGVEVRKVQNRITSGMKVRGIVAPEGLVFRKLVTADLKLCIQLVEGVKKGTGKKKKAAKAAA